MGKLSKDQMKELVKVVKLAIADMKYSQLQLVTLGFAIGAGFPPAESKALVDEMGKLCGD